MQEKNAMTKKMWTQMICDRMKDELETDYVKTLTFQK